MTHFDCGFYRVFIEILCFCVKRTKIWEFHGLYQNIIYEFLMPTCCDYLVVDYAKHKCETFISDRNKYILEDFM